MANELKVLTHIQGGEDQQIWRQGGELPTYSTPESRSLLPSKVKAIVVVAIYHYYQKSKIVAIFAWNPAVYDYCFILCFIIYVSIFL